MMRITLPFMKLPSLANCRMHWRAMDKLKKGQKQMVGTFLLGCKLPALPAVITLTRIGPRKLDDDNLASAFKYVRDEVARHYGVDDGSGLYAWRYEQRVEKGYSVEIQIEKRDVGKR